MSLKDHCCHFLELLFVILNLSKKKQNSKDPNYLFVHIMFRNYIICYRGQNHSIDNSSLFPTSLYLHSNSTQILALKKMVFLNFFFVLPFFYATFQCGRYGVFKKKLNFFFGPEKVKKRASKVAHNRPRPLYFTVQPRPTANSPELILHIKKSRDQTSVLLSAV